MKRARIVLTAVAVLAVCGGAVAFKASRGNNILVYTESNGRCNMFATLSDCTLSGLGNSIMTRFSLASTTVSCPVRYVFSLQ